MIVTNMQSLGRFNRCISEINLQKRGIVMKKLLAAILVLILMAASAALAEEASPWYEVSAENTVLTVRLPGNSKDGLDWRYEISAPEVMELLTSETTDGESEGMAGSPTTYTASFKAVSGQTGNVSLIFVYAAEGEEQGVKTWVLETEVDESGKISLLSVYQQEESADWCMLADDGYTLVVTLPANASTGYAWTADILDPNMLELTSEENAAGNSDLLGAPGTYTATLKGTFEQAGSTEISFAYSRGAEELAESRTVDVFVNESNELFIERVSVLNLLP